MGMHCLTASVWLGRSGLCSVVGRLALIIDQLRIEVFKMEASLGK